jgi:hypothetical protein
MSGPGPLVALGGIVTVALAAAVAFESVYDVSANVRPRDPIVARSHETRSAPRQPLTLRLVDSGGIGLSPDDWGRDYSHARRAFRDVILEAPPYLDAAAFERCEREWRSYVERMIEYGNNAIAVPLLLELIDFDRVSGSLAGAPVYEARSAFRARHAAVRRAFGPLFEWTARRGMQVFLDTDMPVLTPALSDRLRRLAPDASATGIDTANSAVWDVYRAGFEELFDALPSITGVVIRFGEGGSLYNTEGWPYRSEMGVRSAASLRAMLRGLLPVFEARQKTLVLRSWTVGVGQLGRLHLDPAVYDAVLGDIDSPALIVSTKYTAGDFFSYLPLNPTLAAGRQRRIIEFQAKPEFEGFGAFPDFLGSEYAQALRAFRSVNPHIAGAYVMPQFGGPLRAGPRMIYPRHGFWLWTDANVFVASRLAVDPDADVRQLARQWAAARFGNDARVVDAVTNVLIQTREAVLNGFYIRPFAERTVRIHRFELPPLMWIFEWNMVGGWHSLSSLVYDATRDDIDRAIAEGDAAVDLVRRARQQLQAAFATRESSACGEACDNALRSLDYQETLFEALAAWRQTSLSYYRWLDTGDDKAWTMWLAGRTRFATAAAEHRGRFAGDLNFPAFDLRSASEAVTMADRAAWVRRIAAVLLIGMAALLVRWRAFRTSAMTSWRLAREPLNTATALAVTLLTLALVAFLAGALTGFATPWIAVGAPLVVGVAAMVFASTRFGMAANQRRDNLLASSVSPVIPGAIVLLALVAWFGPVGIWFSFWTSSIFRIVFVTLVLAMPAWTAYAMLAVRADEGWRAGIGGLLAAAGAALLALTALLPDWVHVLRFLDRPLSFAPATDTMVFALRTYAGVSLGIGRVSWIVGALLLAGGYTMCAIGRTGARRSFRRSADPYTASAGSPPSGP